MQTLSPSTITLLVLIPLLAWRIYARFRRMVGRQRSSRIRPWITLTIFPALALLLGFAARAHTERVALLALGLGAGALLGVFGLGRTRFEPTKQGLFYTPNAHLGIALSLLFLARIAYRVVEVYVLDPHGPHGFDDFGRSPLTLAVFGLLAGYYIAYAIGLVRWRHRVLQAKRQREALESSVAPGLPAQTANPATPGSQGVDMNHPLRCRCGNLQGHVSHPAESINRGICYCKDCQAYAHFLGKTGDILDDRGGTDVVAILPRNLHFTQGAANLACMSLTQKGLLRWYASCCNTPIGNTSRNFKMSYVGVVHTCLENPSTSVESSFGPVSMWISTKSAKGTSNPIPEKKMGAIFRILKMLIRSRLDGSYKITPLFNPDRGVPVVEPKVLSSSEHERLMKTV
jgi:Family of unknown function (DUF6151)